MPPTTLPAPTDLPIGRVKSFGKFGPKYLVGDQWHESNDGDWLVEIVLVESGERSHYRLSSLRDDPFAD